MNIVLSGNKETRYVPQAGDHLIVNSPEDLLGKLREGNYDSIVVIADEYPSARFIRAIHSRAPLSALFILSNSESALSWQDSLFIDKSFHLPLSNDEMIDLQRRLEIKQLLIRSGIAGRSDAIYNIGQVIHRVSQTNLAVFITGESGVGKEVVAKAIHDNSLRSGGRFLPVNAGAIPETLLEAELFGHVKGAFTGANFARSGHFKQADGGTIFLDEIGELPQQSQVKLLRILESGEFFPVGSSKPETADVRIIAATNRDIKERVQSGAFREDLYYRLGVVNIFIPPLRERPKDTLMLTEFFQNLLEDKSKRSFPGFDDSAISGLLSYNFPGNVRELKNLVENAILLAGERQVSIDDLKSYFDVHSTLGRKLPQKVSQDDFSQSDMMRILGYIANELRTIRESIEELKNDNSRNRTEEERIEDALTQTNGNRTEAAKLLGMSRRTLYRKIEKYGL